MNDDVATDDGRDGRAERRRRSVALAGHRGNSTAARRGLADRDPGVRAAAVGALARLGELTAEDVLAALADDAPAVRRRAVDAATLVRGKGSRSALPAALAAALADPDPLVVVGAAWFAGERRYRPAVPALVSLATTHDDARCREGRSPRWAPSVTRPGSMPCSMRSPIARPSVAGATVALAGFDDPRVGPALRRSAEDRDRQVRQAAEELLDSDTVAADPPSGPSRPR